MRTTSSSKTIRRDDAGISTRGTRPPANMTQLLVRGLAAGFVATQTLDVLSMFFYENLPPADRLHEDRTRSGHQAYEVMVMNLAKQVGVRLNEDEIKYWGWKFHRSFGLSGGLQYMMLREKFPAIGKWYGLAYGLAFFAIADELLIYLTKATPGPQRFNWKSHARGAAAHIAYGVACELVARSFEKVAEYESGTGWALAEDLGRPMKGLAMQDSTQLKSQTGKRANTRIAEDVNAH